MFYIRIIFVIAVKQFFLPKCVNWKVGILVMFPSEWKYKIIVCNTMLDSRFSAR